MSRFAAHPQHRTQLVCWLMGALLWVQLLAPGLSTQHVLTRLDTAWWQEVCSTTNEGTKTSPSSPSSELLAQMHCGVCLIGSTPQLLDGRHAQTLPAPAPTNSARLAHPAQYLLETGRYTLAQPRAPPLFS